VIKIRYNMGDELQYGFVMPLFPLFPILAVIFQGVLAVFLHEMGRLAWIIAPAWVGGGIVIYHAYSKSRATATEDEIHVLAEEEAEKGDEYRVMVSVANPDNALSLVKHTYAVCRAKQARVELLHMVPVPDQVPLSAAARYMLAGKEAITEVMLYLAPLFPISSTLRYCRNVARGIVSAVRQKRTQLLIMGWHGRSRAHGFTLGSTVDPVIERAPCDVMIFKNCSDQTFKRVLVPVAGGPNSVFALETGSILADRADGELVAFTVDGGGKSAFDVDAFLDEHRDRIALPRERVRTRSVENRDVAGAILAEVHNAEHAYDLVVVGCTREPRLYKFTRESVPERIAKDCDRPLVMVNKSSGIRSWIKRWV